MQPEFVSIKVWSEQSGLGRSTTYNLIGDGSLKAIKVRGKTLVDYEAGMAWMRSRPPANIRGTARKAAAQ